MIRRLVSIGVTCAAVLAFSADLGGVRSDMTAQLVKQAPSSSDHPVKSKPLP